MPRGGYVDEEDEAQKAADQLGAWDASTRRFALQSLALLGAKAAEHGEEVAKLLEDEEPEAKRDDDGDPAPSRDPAPSLPGPGALEELGCRDPAPACRNPAPWKELGCRDPDHMRAGGMATSAAADLERGDPGNVRRIVSGRTWENILRCCWADESGHWLQLIRKVELSRLDRLGLAPWLLPMFSCLFCRALKDRELAAAWLT
ncbi:unnamed protein product [Effrenium voratum]|nr:unnamed protein product [Effrenium voratum]